MPAALNTAGTPRRSWFVEIDIAEIVRNARLKIGECSSFHRQRESPRPRAYNGLPGFAEDKF